MEQYINLKTAAKTLSTTTITLNKLIRVYDIEVIKPIGRGNVKLITLESVDILKKYLVIGK